MGRLLSTTIVRGADVEIRWNSKFRESYSSEAESTQVSFTVQAPPQVDGTEKYPLLIALSGGFRVSPSEQFPFFQANPTRTRILGLPFDLDLRCDAGCRCHVEEVSDRS
jgi:hypothetical protein